MYAFFDFIHHHIFGYNIIDFVEYVIFCFLHCTDLFFSNDRRIYFFDIILHGICFNDI